MVDPYQVLIDNGNSTSTNNETPKLSATLIQNMNESETSQHHQYHHQQKQQSNSSPTINSIETFQLHQQHQLERNVADAIIQKVYECDQRVYESVVHPHRNEFKPTNDIMCGPSAKHGTDSKITAKRISSVDGDCLYTCKDSDCATNVVKTTAPLPFQNGLSEIVSSACSIALPIDIEKKGKIVEQCVSALSRTNKLNSNSETGLSQNKIATNSIGTNKVCVIVSNKAGDRSDISKSVAERLNFTQSAVVIDDVPDAIRSVQIPSASPLPPSKPTPSSSTATYSVDGKLQIVKSQSNESNKFSNQVTVDITSNSAIIDSESIQSSWSEMDSRKVEPLRININREPIKTKIKLVSDRQTANMSPSRTKYATVLKTSSASMDSSVKIDEAICDNMPQQVFPKITIKPIVKPSSEPFNSFQHKKQLQQQDQQNHHFLYNSNSLHAHQETIPKLKIKKVDPTSSSSTLSTSSSTLTHLSSFGVTSSSNHSNRNLIPHSTSLPLSIDGSSKIVQHHQKQQLTGPHIVPTLATLRSSTNTSIDSNSCALLGGPLADKSCGVINANNLNKSPTSTELVPKLTIKLDNHQQNAVQINSMNKGSNCMSKGGVSTSKDMNQIPNDGVKVHLKRAADPPLPKFTIITNAMNDTAEVVIVNSATSDKTDESSDEQTAIECLPPSYQPPPNTNSSTHCDYAANVISSTLSISSDSLTQNAEDNLSTCSSGSSSSFSSNSSNNGPNNDIKLIIKATSTGNCVVSPNTTSVIRNSSSGKNSIALKLNSKIVSSTITVEPDQLNCVNAITVASTTTATTTTNDAIPKLNIKLSTTDYPQLIHNDVDRSEIKNDRMSSPIPKLMIRQPKSTIHDENIVIPKVTIKPVVNPDDILDAMSVEAPIITPKIILKPIPKRIDKPLEIITAPNSPFKCSVESEGQQSPRIILKINKNATSQTTEATLLTKPSSSSSSTAIIADKLTLMDNKTESQTALTASMVTKNELKRAKFTSDGLQSKKQKLITDDDEDVNDVVQLLTSDSEQDESNYKSNDDDNALDQISLQTNVITTTKTNTSATADPPISVFGTSFDSNSDLRSILSRSIQTACENIIEATPAFKSTSDNETINNDVIDLCHDSNDQLLGTDCLSSPASPSGDQTEQIIASLPNNEHSESSTESVPKIVVNVNHSEAIKSDKIPGCTWQFFYGAAEQENAVHPLLQHNINRANVLEAMMSAANDLEKSHTPNESSSNNNNSTSKDGLDKENAVDLMLHNDDSSSDCIVIEDTGSDLFPSVAYGSGQDAASEENGQKKESIDRDSGVDVSNSIKSASRDGHEDELTPAAAKRPRGRPRKDGTPPGSSKKQQNSEDLSKRKFAGILMPSHNSHTENGLESMPNLTSPIRSIDAQAHVSPTLNMVVDRFKNHQVYGGQQTTILTSSGTMTITSTTLPLTPYTPLELMENKITIAPIDPIITIESKTNDFTLPLPSIQTVSLLSSPTSEIPKTQVDSNASIKFSSPLTTDVSITAEIDATAAATAVIETATATISTPLGSKERRRRIIIDDDDESPTFNPVARGNKKLRGKGRRGRGGLLRHKQRKLNSLLSLDKSHDSVVFTSPEGIDQSRRKFLFKDATTPVLQIFEEDTRMSADSLFTSGNRNSELFQNEESQSSLHSSASATIEGSTKKIRSKIEVADPEGKTEFTVDMIAEYDWPPPKGCCRSRHRDAFMIQEQIAEYLGVKSFKRKYPDLPRRMVEMEERNYLSEKGMVSEKMCNLGLTAVLASDVLDIMHTDFYEKYEEYRKYLREKQIRDLTARQKFMQTGVGGKSLSARENAIRAASAWNSSFNRSRKENRRECLDLQNFVIQIPEVARIETNRPVTELSNYPVALVPGQFQDHYGKHSAAELLCYPLNTVIADPYQLDRKLREYYNKSDHWQNDRGNDSGSDSDSDSEDSNTSLSGDSNSSDSSNDSCSSSDSSSNGDDDDEDEKKPIKVTDVPTDTSKKQKPKMKKSERNKCRICSGPERCNQLNRPEVFVSCSVCQRNAHPTCIRMPPRMVKRANEYAWLCSDCKHCIKCRRTENEDKMLFCDQCDRGYHIYCIGLRKVPNGQWHCAVCTVCTLCGVRRPEGHNNPNLTPQQKQKLLAVAKWTHEYQVNSRTNLHEHTSMLCTSCVAIKHSAANNIYYN